MSTATPVAPAATAEEEHTLAARRLRAFSFGQVILLVAQTVLGMRVNLFIQVPADDQGKGLLSSFGDAMSKGPAELAAHAGFGLLVFIDACLLVVFSLTVRGASVKIASILGWLAIAGAAVSGAAFINATADSSTANNASFTMAALTMVAVACYAWNLFAATPAMAAAEPVEAAAPKPSAAAEGEAETEAAATVGAAAESETEAEAEAAEPAAEETEVKTENESGAEAETEADQS